MKYPEDEMKATKHVTCKICEARFKAKAQRIDLPNGYYTHGFLPLCDDCDEATEDLHENMFTDLVAEACAERGLL